MIHKIEKNEIRGRIHKRIRSRLQGTSERPRLAVFRSVAHIYAQVIDDSQGKTLVSASSVDKGARPAKAAKPAEGAKAAKGARTGGGNVAAAKTIGKLVAERAKEKGITRVVFDRGGYQYHGRVKALADAARAAGLEF
jgi:large subunit ribosomal protein L18